MQRDPRVFLEDVRLAAADIAEFTRGRSADDFNSDELLRAAVERKFIIIGEALSRLAKLDSQWAAEIMDFGKIVGFRNILVHGYEMIDNQVVWQTIQTHLPVLLKQVEQLADSLK